MNEPRPSFTIPDNPYVGPVSFTRNETLYGRRRETMALADLLISRRIVLLYAPSGAGKTSLIQAALIPELERRHRFRISSVLRVNHVPEKVDPARTNRYVLSTLRHLERGFNNAEVPEGRQFTDAELAGYTIPKYFDRRWPPGTGRREYDLLVFDQFEEIFTLDPVDRDAKREFFRQLGEALGDRDDDDGQRTLRWCLISMREDHIAELDDFRDLVPTALAASFRMNLLERERAGEAIRNPAADHGVTIDNDAVKKLLDDLCKVRVVDSSGPAEGWAIGDLVEPVQLQVVCRRLWGKVVHDGTRAISVADQAAVAGATGSEVDRALADFYESEIRKVAGATGVRERLIRDWFERVLITPNLVRSQVLREHDGAGAITPAVIDALIESHLLRGDKRGGREWVELTHDRLIQPILKSNTAWRDAHLVPLQRQAELWVKGGRSPGYLLTGEVLERAAAQAEEVDLDDVEREFLAACRVAERARWLSRWAAISAPIMLALTVFSIYTAYTSVKSVFATDDALRRAKVQERLGDIRLEIDKADRRGDFREALAKALDADASISKARDELHATTVRGRRAGGMRQWIVAKFRSLFGAGVAEQEGDKDLQAESVTVEASLLAALRDAPPIAARLEGHLNPIRALAFAENGTQLLSAGDDGRVFAWDPATRARKAVSERGRGIFSMAYHGGRGLCAAGDASGAITLWKVSQGATESVARLAVEGATPRTRTGLAFHPSGEWLVSTISTGPDRRIAIWDVRDPARARLAREVRADAHNGVLSAVAVSRDGQYIVTAGWDGRVNVWRFDGGDAPVAQLQAVAAEGSTIQLNAVAISPDKESRYIAAGGADGSVLLWDMKARGGPSVKRLRGLEGHAGAVFGVDFSPGGRALASTGVDRTLIVWDLEHAATWDPQEDLPIRRRITALPERIYSAAFDPTDADRIALGGTRTVLIVDLTGPSSPLTSLLPDPDPGPERDGLGLRRRWEGVAIVRDDTLVAATRRDNVHFWRIDPSGASEPQLLRGLELRHKALSRFAVSADGMLVATGTEGGEVILWSLGERDMESRSTLPGRAAPIQALAFNRDHTLLAVAAGEDLELWNVANPAAPARVEAAGLESVHARSVAFSPTEDLLVVAGADPDIRLVRVTGGRMEAVSEIPSTHQSDVNAVAFFPSGNGFVTAGEDLAVLTWSLTEPAKEPATGPLRKPLKTLRPDEQRFTEHGRGVVSVVAAEQEGRELVFSADRDGTVIARLSVTDERNTWPLVERFRRRALVAGNPSGTLLATSGQAVTLWNLHGAHLRQIACDIAPPERKGDRDPCAAYRRRNN